MIKVERGFKRSWIAEAEDDRGSSASLQAPLQRTETSEITFNFMSREGGAIGRRRYHAVNSGLLIVASAFQLMVVLRFRGTADVQGSAAASNHSAPNFLETRQCINVSDVRQRRLDVW